MQTLVKLRALTGPGAHAARLLQRQTTKRPASTGSKVALVNRMIMICCCGQRPVTRAVVSTWCPHAAQPQNRVAHTQTRPESPRRSALAAAAAEHTRMVLPAADAGMLPGAMPLAEPLLAEHRQVQTSDGG